MVTTTNAIRWTTELPAAGLSTGATANDTACRITGFATENIAAVWITEFATKYDAWKKNLLMTIYPQQKTVLL